MKKIASIGYEIPGHSDLLIDFSSKKSLMDYDVIIFAPILPYYNLSSVGNGSYLGKTCYGESGSFELGEDFNHWEKELTNALEAGKSVFFLLSDKEEFYVDTGSRSYSGSGRNRNTTINVKPGNNYEMLPVDIGKIIPASGKELVFTGNGIFKNFFEKFKEYLQYRLYIEDIRDGNILFTGKDKTKILSMIVNVKSGSLIFLPFIDYDEDSFTETKENKKGKKETYWTKEAIKFGSNLVSCLLEIDVGLLQICEKTPPPDWLKEEEFTLAKEKAIQKEIKSNLVEIDKLAQSNKKLGEDLEKEVLLKDLLFEQGKPLEEVVIKALEILDFKAGNYDDGELELDQVIITPENMRFIGECEGKDTKDINIDKLRQLVESLNADSFKEEVSERASGILFGNPQRLVDPKERTLDFTEKCKKSAEREKVALIKTIDLFKIVKYLSENDNSDYKKLCRDAIYQGFGKIVLFPELPTQVSNPQL